VLAQARMDRGIDMTVTALLGFGGGRSASVWASLESAREQRLTVITPDQVHQREMPFSAYRDPHDPYQLMVESFGDSVLMDRPVAIPLEDSIANMRTLDRIRKAASTP